jgi:hypothetical protein
LFADGRGPECQRQKGGLERVVSRVRIAEHAPAHPKHHGTVPVHELSERQIIALVGKAPKQVLIEGLGRPFLGGDLVDEMHNGIHLRLTGHRRTFR